MSSFLCRYITGRGERSRHESDSRVMTIRLAVLNVRLDGSNFDVVLKTIQNAKSKTNLLKWVKFCKEKKRVRKLILQILPSGGGATGRSVCRRSVHFGSVLKIS